MSQTHEEMPRSFDTKKAFAHLNISSAIAQLKKEFSNLPGDATTTKFTFGWIRYELTWSQNSIGVARMCHDNSPLSGLQLLSPLSDSTRGRIRQVSNPLRDATTCQHQVFVRTISYCFVHCPENI